MKIGSGISDIGQVTLERCEALSGQPIAIDLICDAHLRPDISDALLNAIAHEMAADLTSGNIRRTYAGRYDDLDAEIARNIQRFFSGKDTVHLHDVGVSNAITSVDLFKKIQPLAQVHMVASDFRVSLYSVNLDDGWRLVCGIEGDVLQIIGRDVVLPVPPRRRFTSRPLVWLKTRRLAKRLAPAAQDILRDGNSVNRREIDLFHPSARKLAAAEPRFSLEVADLTSLRPSSIDVLRAMSVLFNWPEERRLAAYASFFGALKQGGILILGRGGHRIGRKIEASIFRIDGQHLKPVFETGGGFENRNEILEHWDATASSRSPN